MKNNGWNGTQVLREMEEHVAAWRNKKIDILPLQWCHNERDGISNHQPHHCLLNQLSRRRSNKISKLCVTDLCEGNSPVPDKGQWRGTLMFSLICVWINGWVNNREVCDLRSHRAHYDVIVMMTEVTHAYLRHVTSIYRQEIQHYDLL